MTSFLYFKQQTNIIYVCIHVCIYSICKYIQSFSNLTFILLQFYSHKCYIWIHIWFECIFAMLILNFKFFSILKIVHICLNMINAEIILLLKYRYWYTYIFVYFYIFKRLSVILQNTKRLQCKNFIYDIHIEERCELKTRLGRQVNSR